MEFKEQIEYAKTHYPKEYEIAKRLSYPENYFLFGCKWLHDIPEASDTAIKYFLIQWDKYVKDEVDINTIKDTNELAWTVFKYRKAYENSHRVE